MATIEAWYMANAVVDQTAENRTEPNHPVTISDLRDLGVIHWHIPPVGDYPAKADKQLAAIRESRGYNYADIITCSEEWGSVGRKRLTMITSHGFHLNFMFFCAGDLIVLPEGIYHRFTMDTKNFTHAMRLFKGVPVWTPINRPADTHLSRERYLQRFQPLEEELSLRSTIVSCLRGFFAQGWCLGSSGAMACRVTSKADVTAICHIHSVPAIVAAENKEVLRIRDSEMIKGLGVSGDGVLVVPIIDNKATEPDLVPDLIRALQRYPSCPAVLDHGAYVFGSSAEKAKIATESREEVVEAPRKRLRRGPAVVLLDVEGTTTPISFVKEKLFPYAATAVPFIWSKEEVLRLTKEWIAKDRKDTPEAMAAWVAAGKRVAIFSSGSREAQRLIYQYSDKGDLTSYLSAYFDPKSAQASKQEAKAYEEIALSMGINPSEGLFCTDVLGEAQAARKAGWQAVLLKRPGNAPLPESHGFREATSLLDV
eukprot:g25666.t1